jgi:hypothetical protein
MPQDQTQTQPATAANNPGVLDAIRQYASSALDNLKSRFTTPGGQPVIQAGPGSALDTKNNQLQQLQPQQPYSALQQNAPMLTNPTLSHAQSPYGTQPGEQRIDTSGMTGFTNIKRSPGL